MRKLSVVLASGLVLGIVVLLLPATRDQGQAYAGKMPLSYFEALTTVKEALKLIQHQYVDGSKVEEKELVYGAIEGMFGKLEDPYSRFMKPSAFDNMQQETSGEFGGLGILIGVKDKLLTVIAPIEGTPAYKAGILAGDKIIKVEGKSTKGMSVNDAVNLLRGKRGSPVELTIRRAEAAPRAYVVVRDVIKIPSVRGKMINENIGYAYISQFIQSTGEDLDKVVAQLHKDHDLKGFVLDLRNNPGGLLSAAVEVGKVFLSRKNIVSLKGRRGDEVNYRAYADSPYANVPIVVLTNEGSASASEIVAGALRDNNRAVIVGQKTFGKGSVQTVLPLQDGSAVALTTAYYYTPSGVCIHKVGIEPDVAVDLPQLSEEQLKEYREVRERTFQESVEPVSSSKDAPYMEVSPHDTQLMAAVNLLKDANTMLSRLIAPTTVVKGTEVVGKPESKAN